MTATLYEIMERGLDKIFDEENKYPGIEPNENGIITFLDSPDYLTKIIKYDSEVQEVINGIFSFSFESSACDSYVKKTFLRRFLDRTIKWEFVPVTSFAFAPKIFTMKLASLCGEKDKYLSYLYDNFEKYMSSNKKDTSVDGATTTNENNMRELFATLPQDSFNIDVKDYVSPTADDNRLQNTLNSTKHDESKTNESLSFNADILKTMNRVFTDFFEECDKRLFSQIWGVHVHEQNN